MIALKQCLVGFLIAHAAWAYFFITGSCLRIGFLVSFRERHTSIAGSSATLEIVLTTASGIAVTGLMTFALALAHALYLITACAWVGALVTLCVLFHDSPFKADFWLSRARLWQAAVSPATLAVYLFAIIIGIRAYLPDIGSDATAYHVAYAYDWASTHRLVVDQWLRFPYYASNWPLLDVWMILIGLIQYVPYLTWLTGLLSLFAVQAGVVAFSGDSAENAKAVQLTSLATVAAVGLSVIFIKWATSGFIDVQIGFFFVSFALAVVGIAAFRRRGWVVHAVCCGAFLIGLKVSLIALLPMAAIALVVSSVIAGIRLKHVAIAIVALVALSSPWYIRNFVLAGDPIAPTLNLAVRGVDSKWSAADMKDVMGDLKSDNAASSIAALPVNLFLHPDSHEFREPGVTLLVLFLILPGLVVATTFVRPRGPFPLTMGIFAALVLYALAYWNLTSHLARYALLFYAALAILVGWTLLHVFRRREHVALMLMLLCAIPSPTAAQWYYKTWTDDYLHEWTWFNGYESWLTPRAPAYPQLKYISDAFLNSKRNDLKVYGVQTQDKALYFRERGLTLIGDWYGPERYVDFAYAVRTNSLGQYVERFNIGAFIIPSPSALIPTRRNISLADLAAIDREMSALHFVRIDLKQERRFVVYLSPALQSGLRVRRGVPSSRNIAQNASTL